VIPKAIIYFLRPKSSVIRSLFTITRGLFEICWSLPQTYLLRPKLSTWTRTSSENEQMVRRPTKWKGRQMHERNCTPRRLGQCEQHTHSRFCAIPITRRGNFEAPSMFQVLFQKKKHYFMFQVLPTYSLGSNLYSFKFFTSPLVWFKELCKISHIFVVSYFINKNYSKIT
jgi:hypothetical protein